MAKVCFLNTIRLIWKRTSGNTSTTFIDGAALFGGLESRIMEITGFSRAITVIITAALVMVAFFILARAIRILITNVLPRSVTKTETMLDDEIIKALKGPAQWLVIALGCLPDHTGDRRLFRLPERVPGQAAPGRPHLHLGLPRRQPDQRPAELVQERHREKD
jgi:hypothetical protein